MRALWKLTLTQVKLYVREPIAAFFTLAYAPMMLVLFGSIYGNEPTPLFGGRGTVDVSVPAYTALIIVAVGLIGLPIETATSREMGVLRRYRATPLRPTVYLAAEVLVYFAMTLLGVLFLILVGKIGYNMRFDGNPVMVLGGFMLGTLSFFSLGFLIASLAPTARIAQTVGMVLAFPMMFLSGASIPLEVLPPTVRHVSQFVPLTYVVTLLRGLWRGDVWADHLTETGVLVGLLIVGVVLSARTFRWE
ncbi:MAG: ABC transporter permease [Chloroflexota bacterium]